MHAFFLVCAAMLLTGGGGQHVELLPQLVVVPLARDALLHSAALAFSRVCAAVPYSQRLLRRTPWHISSYRMM